MMNMSSHKVILFKPQVFPLLYLLSFDFHLIFLLFLSYWKPKEMYNWNKQTNKTKNIDAKPKWELNVKEQEKHIDFE